ncbi:MAG: murein biosynthesis integral membrane protein MurJ [Phototrophicales bacterium]|nr:MAG: murein biosynthesis integral membrane protein MurJ [Phototrophicales bacterium]RMG71527.1 MAG: murein biosynthesis integral membrane protein MurJ [Chloroflexota bacterium]
MTTQRNRQIARSTLIVMLAFGAAKVISLAQTFIIANVFGAGEKWDSFVTANRLPELIVTLISGGALANAFIPVFTGYLTRDEDKSAAWRLASHVINTLFVLTGLVSIIVFFTAPWLVENIVAPGFNPAERAQTVELMRILLLSTMIFSVSGIVMGILQSHNHFLLPALAPIMFDLGILFGVGFLIPIFGVNGVAIGAVIGAAMHFGVQIPGLIRFRAQWIPQLGLSDPMLWKVIRLMLPRVAGLGVFSFNFLVMNNIASRLGTGAVSSLDWGWRLMQIPQTILGTAMGIVIFPTLSALSELGDENGKRDAMSGALRFILIATIPASVGLIFVGRPLISLLERGAFDATASALVYSTLQFFALGLIVHSALEVIARSFYADKDTVTPLYAALGGALINLIGSFVFSNVNMAQVYIVQDAMLQLSNVPLAIDVEFLRATGFVGGLALANSLGVMFEVGFLLVILRRRWHGVNDSALARTILKTTAASVVMAAAIVVVNLIWGNLIGEGGFIMTVVKLGVEVSIGAIVFLIVAGILRMEELTMLLKLIVHRDKASPDALQEAAKL